MFQTVSACGRERRSINFGTGSGHWPEADDVRLRDPGGTPVKSSERKHLGDVDRLIVDVAANRLEFLVIDKGIFSDGRLVEVRHIARADEHEVVLSLGAHAASSLPVFVHEEFVQARGTMIDGSSRGGMVDAEDPGNKWVIYGSDAGQFAHTGTQPLFMAPPIGTAVTEDMSNVSESDVTIGKGTRVVDRDFKTIGHVRRTAPG